MIAVIEIERSWNEQKDGDKIEQENLTWEPDSFLLLLLLFTTRFVSGIDASVFIPCVDDILDMDIGRDTQRERVNASGPVSISNTSMCGLLVGYLINSHKMDTVQ